ncbi:MAG: NADH-quinone oxidoreductase subunit M [Planctomycetes bacterium]|nr:NADH-quinone oxidoreductase subunit M [Planctomycetota bacterium]
MIGLLALTVLGPLLLAVLAWLLPGERLARHLCLLGALLTFGIGGHALLQCAAHPGAFVLQEQHPWSQAFGIGFAFGVDGIGAAMLLLSGLITAVATILAWHQQDRSRLWHALVLLLLAGMNGVFTALDLVLFYVCWEVVLLPMLLLIGIWGGEQRRYAAIKFFVYTLAGSVGMLFLIVALWANTEPAGQQIALDVTARTWLSLPADALQMTLPRGFDLRHLALQWHVWHQQTLLGVPLSTFGFWAVMLACLVKVPAVPLHTWLPHAHVQAPTAISVLLAGVLLKLGVYGLYRIAWPLFPVEAAAFAPTLGWIGVAGILWGALVALGQTDLKRLVAYSSVSHMGFCLLGLAAGTVAGATGGIVQAFTHGLSSALLFLLVGVLYDRAHHRRIDGFGGLARPMPKFAWLLLLAALAGAGLPGLAGFPGEFLVLTGAFTAGGRWPWLGLLATGSVVLSAAYLLWTQMRVAYGPLRHPEHQDFADCDARERLAAAPLVLLLLVIGIWPGPLVDVLRAPCELLLHHVQGARP